MTQPDSSMGENARRVAESVRSGPFEAMRAMARLTGQARALIHASSEKEA